MTVDIRVSLTENVLQLVILLSPIYLTLGIDLQVVTVAKFQGGGAFNVIPDSVTIGGTFRAFSKESFSQLKRRIVEVWQFE